MFSYTSAISVKPALVLDPPESELYELGGKRLVVAAVT